MRRLRAKIRANRIAKALGVSTGTFSRWENGKDPVPELRVGEWVRALAKMERDA